MNLYRYVVALIGISACSSSVTLEPTHTPDLAAATLTPVATNTQAPSGPLLPSPTVSEAACVESQGRVVSLHYPASLDDSLTPILVYLPPCYREDRQYPTLYALHGLRSSNRQWIALGLAQVMDRKLAGVAWPPFLVAMPFLPEPLFTGTDGGQGSYEQEFQQAVVPYVEGRFSASSQRAVMGISRGAVWALEIAFRDGDSFAAVVALSPSLHVNLARGRYDPLRMPLRDLSLPARILLGVGDGDPEGLASLEQLSQRLAQEGLPHELQIESGGHDNELWQLFLEQALEFVALSW